MRLILAILSVLPLFAHAQFMPPQFELDERVLAQKIVERLDLQPGERFIAVAHPGLYGDLIHQLRYEVMRAGAIDLGVINVLEEPVPATWDEDTLRDGSLTARNTLKDMLASVDASVMLPGSNTSHPAYLALQDLMREGIGRTIHYHWVQGNSAFALPGQPLPPLHVIEQTYQTAILEIDYDELARQQRQFAEAAAKYESALRTAPANLSAANRLAWLEALSG